MGPYSHYLIALKLEPFVKPDHVGEYYLGAIIPDVRHLAGLHRNQTHLSREKIQETLSDYPSLKSFLLGYQIHCLIDEIDVSEIVSPAFPFNLFKRVFHKNFSQQQITMLIELFFAQSTRVDRKLGGSHNAVLSNLGVTPAHTETFVHAMDEYLAAPSFETALSAFQKIGYIENLRIEKYTKAFRAIVKNRIIKKLLFVGIKNAKVDRYAVNYVRSALELHPFQHSPFERSEQSG